MNNIFSKYTYNSCYDKEIIGKSFKKLTPLFYYKNTHFNRTYYVCLCECGNLTHLPRHEIGKIISCGCYRKEKISETKLINISSKKYGRLTVLNNYKNIKNKIFWLCKCDCGTIKWIWSSSLKDGSIRSCGCLLHEYLIKRNVTYVGNKHSKWNNGSSNKEKGYCYKFSRKSVKDNVRKFWNNTCIQCGMTGEECKEKYKAELTVHHVYNNRNSLCDDSPKMFVTLCKSCHSKLNTTNETYKDYCKNLYLEAIRNRNGKCMYTKQEYFKIFKNVDISE
jgi:hypothetical protein